MKKIIFGLLISAVFIFSNCSDKNQITTGSLLMEMIDRDRLAEFPNPAYSTKQFSSYDRKSISPDQPGWFANADRSQFIRIENNHGRREFVLFDAEGPGAIVRFWITVAMYEGNGTLRIYIDNKPKPELDGKVLKMMSGGGILEGPLATSVSNLTEYIKRGHNLYFPIPYKKHCKITYESPGVDEQPGAISGEAFYYNINYRTYDQSVSIASFSQNNLANYAEEIKLVQSSIIDYNRATPKNVESQKLSDVILSPDHSAEIEIQGAKAIRQIVVKLTADNQEQALRSTVFEMEFDDKQTVWCPIGDFYGTGYKISPYSTWYSRVDNDGTMACKWTMPFAESGIVRIKNYGDQEITIEYFNVETSDYTWTDNSMYFGAGWREYNRISTREEGKNMDEVEKERFDLDYVTLSGKGVLVGNGVTLFNTADHWWGEGDEKISVDGENFPSHFGTGSEDFYGYAWSNPNKFDHPFIAQPDGSGANVPGYAVNLRYRSLDAIPFNNGLNFDMEMWHSAKTVINYAPVSYWYMFSGGKSNLHPVPDQVQNAVALSRLDFFLEGYADRNVFIEETLVNIIGKENGFEIRYTLDRSEPTINSTLYTGPFKLRHSALVKSKGFSSNGFATETLEGQFIKQKPIKGERLNNPKPGLKYDYFELDYLLQSTQELYSFDVKKSGSIESVKYPEFELPLKFGLVYTGYVHVEKAGIYIFSTISNDGSMMYIHDQLVVNNDGPHGSRERSGQIALAPGYHPINLEYKQIGGTKFLEAYIEGPDLTKHEILPSELAH